MAEYINYGDQQIDLLALLTAMADNVLSYVNSQTWSNKRKEKFLNAYLNMVNGGIKGASIENGTWGINIGNNIDLSTMGKKDREMYQEAAYFIQNLMRNLLPKAEEEKKPEEEKEKEVFDFNKHFGQALLNSFGGSKETLEKNWESLDSAQDNGLFSRTGRAAKIKQALLSLKDSIKEEDYNFEKSSYGSHKNFTDKLNAAINALDNPDTAKEALLSLGVNYKGLLDDYADQKIPLSDGTEITRAEYAALKAKQLEDEQLKVAKQEALVKQGNRGVVTLTSGIHGTDVRTQPEAYSQYLAKTYGTGQQGFNKINQEVYGLLNKAYNNGEGNGLTAEEKRKLGNFLFYIRANNPNSKAGNWNITPQEWELLKWSKYAKSQNQNDYIRLPWQTSDGRYTFADNQGNIFFVKTSGHLKIDFNRSKNYNNYKNNFLKNKTQINNETPVFKQDKDILISDMTSMLGDIVSLGGGYAGAAGGITSLIFDLYGDIRRGKDTWSVIKNLGANIAWGAAGLIPGVKLGKVAKTAARVYATLLSAGILMDNDILQSWKNLISGKDISAKDFENFKWTLHAITGGTNAVRSHYTEKNLNNKIKQPTVETKSGKQITATTELINRINKTGRRGGLAAAEKQFKEMFGEEAKPGSFLFPEGPRAKYNPVAASKKLHNIFSSDEKLKPSGKIINQEAVNRFLEKDKNKPYVSILTRPFGYNIFNSRFWTEGGPNRGGISYVLNSYRNPILQGLQEQNSSEILGLPRKPYNSPKVKILELIPKERRLPSPENITSKGIVDILKVNSRPTSNLSLRESLREINNWIDSYGLNSKRSKFSSIKGGYDSSKPLENGIYTYEIPISSGERIPLILNKSNNGIVVTIKEKSKTFKRIEEARQYMSQQIYDLTKKVSYKEIAQTLEKMKRTKGLKQGGTIDKLRILKYKEYIKK